MPTSDRPRCSVVILNYNGAEYTVACYQGAVQQTLRDREIVIVDNASTDGSADRIAAECPHARLVRHEINEGTGGGFAVGADHARGEFILFLCNDTVMDPDVIEKMVAVMDARPDCGVCGAKQVFFHRPDIIDCLGYVPDRLGFLHFWNVQDTDDGCSDVRDAWVNGSVFMIRRDVYDTVGGYDRLLFTLNDEVDLCWRVRTHGYTSLICTAARVRHHNSATLSLASRDRTRFWAERHLLRMLIKNYSGAYLCRILPQYLAIQACEILFLLSQRLFGMAWSDLRALGWNVSHFPDTWREHRRLQKSRTVSDFEFTGKLWPRAVKIEWGLQILRERRSFRDDATKPRHGSQLELQPKQDGSGGHQSSRARD